MISVIVPVYNVEMYLEDCLLSIQNQTYKDWECILVDDGSSDRSSLICDEWADKDFRFKVIHQSNQGVAEARNNGIRKALGEYVSFVDSDDWIDLDYLESMCVLSENADYVVSGLKMEYSDAQSELRSPRTTRMIQLRGDPNKNDLDDLVKQGLLYGPHTKLFKRCLLEKYGVLFPKHKIFGEDLQFNFDYLEHIKSIKVIARTMYHYRIIGNNTLASVFRPDQFVNDYEQWCIQKIFYTKKHLFSQTVERFLYRRLWGQIYDGLFLFPRIKGADITYIKEILSVPDISELKYHKDLFECGSWIKWSIIHRCSLPFYVYFVFKMRKNRL